jgi:hypothetical protein
MAVRYFLLTMVLAAGVFWVLFRLDKVRKAKAQYE